MDIERRRALPARCWPTRVWSSAGIHMHLGSPILTTEPYEAGGAESGSKSSTNCGRQGHETNWINLGGGFGINYRGQECCPPPSICRGDRPRVFRRRIAGWRWSRAVRSSGNAGVLVSRVIFTKREGGKLFVIQDAAMNDLVRPGDVRRVSPHLAGASPRFRLRTTSKPRFPAANRRMSSGRSANRETTWPRGAGSRRWSAGDLICTFSAGAYGTAMSSNYNSRPRGAEVLVDGSENPSSSAAARPTRTWSATNVILRMPAIGRGQTRSEEQPQSSGSTQPIQADAGDEKIVTSHTVASPPGSMIDDSTCRALRESA